MKRALLYRCRVSILAPPKGVGEGIDDLRLTISDLGTGNSIAPIDELRLAIFDLGTANGMVPLGDLRFAIDD